MSGPIRVVLVDDQALFRAGIRMVIDSQPDLEVVGEAGDGAEGLRVVRATRPDVVLMDIRMPVMDGLAATAELLADPSLADAPPRIVMLTTFDLDEAAARAIRQGASGFLLKDAEPELLLAALRTVHAGSSVIAGRLHCKTGPVDEQSRPRNQPAQALHSPRNSTTGRTSAKPARWPALRRAPVNPSSST